MLLLHEQTQAPTDKLVHQLHVSGRLQRHLWGLDSSLQRSSTPYTAHADILFFGLHQPSSRLRASFPAQGRLKLFKTEASACWEDFLQALEAEEKVGSGLSRSRSQVHGILKFAAVGGGLDIDASSLRLPTMREETRQIIEVRVEEERLKASEEPEKEPDEAAQQPEARAEQEAEEPPTPQQSLTRGRTRGKGRRGRGKGRSTHGAGQRSSKCAGGEEAGASGRGGGRGRARGKDRTTPGSKAAKEQNPLENRPGQAPAGAHEVTAVAAGAAGGTPAAPDVPGQQCGAPNAAARVGTAEAPCNEQAAVAAVEHGQMLQMTGSATGDKDSSSVQPPGLTQGTLLIPQPRQDPAPRRQTRSSTGRLPPQKMGTLRDLPSTSDSASASEPSVEDSALDDGSDAALPEDGAKQTCDQPDAVKRRGSSGPGSQRKPRFRRKPNKIQGNPEAIREMVAVKSKFGGR